VEKESIKVAELSPEEKPIVENIQVVTEEKPKKRATKSKEKKEPNKKESTKKEATKKKSVENLVTPNHKVASVEENEATEDNITTNIISLITPATVTKPVEEPIVAENAISSFETSMEVDLEAHSMNVMFTELTDISKGLTIDFSILPAAEDSQLSSLNSRKESFSEDSSVVFPNLDSESTIDRLVSGSSPLRANSRDFYISPCANTNISCFTSPTQQQLKKNPIPEGIVSLMDHVNAENKEPAAPILLATPKSAEVTEMVQTCQEILAPDSKGPETTIFANQDEDASKNQDQPMEVIQIDQSDVTTENNEIIPIASPETTRSGRKRKPVNAFDPTPPTRAKKAKGKKDTSLPVSSPTAETSIPLEVIEADEAAAKAEDAEAIAAMESEELYFDEVGMKEKKSKAKTRTPKTKKVSISETVGTAIDGAAIPATPAAPVIPVLEPEVQMKVDQIMEKMKSLSSELVVFEK
jgi:hypothetical protein